MLSVVTFKWQKPGYRSVFSAENVNICRRMVARHYPTEHRFICVTDDAAGIDPGIEIIPLWGDHASIVNPSWANGPSCYRRLKVFSEWFESSVTDRFVVLDLDVVITGALSPLWDRDEPFLIWRPNHPGIPICASMFMLRPGAHREIWTQFDDILSPKLTSAAGFRGSDQAWIRYCIGDDAPGWGPADGVYGLKDDIAKGKRGRQVVVSLPSNLEHLRKPQPVWGALPENARIVMFPGQPDPWSPGAQADFPWIAQHYR